MDASHRDMRGSLSTQHHMALVVIPGVGKGTVSGGAVGGDFATQLDGLLDERKNIPLGFFGNLAQANAAESLRIEAFDRDNEQQLGGIAFPF